MMSGFHDELLKPTYKQLSVHSFLSKPFTVAHLLTAVTAALEESLTN